MNFNTNIPGLKEVIVEKYEEVGERTALYVSLPKKPLTCTQCSEITTKVHDYQVQKLKYLKWFERLTILFYKRRSYACAWGESQKNNLSWINISVIQKKGIKSRVFVQSNSVK